MGSLESLKMELTSDMSYSRGATFACFIDANNFSLFFFSHSSISLSFAACCFAYASFAYLYNLTTRISLINLITHITLVMRPARDVFAMDSSPVVWLSKAFMIQPMSATREMVDTTSRIKKNDNQYPYFTMEASTISTVKNTRDTAVNP